MAFSTMTVWFSKTFSPLLSNIIVAVVLLLIGIVIARIAERVVAKILSELEINNWLKKAGIRFALEETITSFIRYALYFIAVVIALNQVGLTAPVLNLVAAGIIVLVIAAILLGIKDFIPNFVAGIRVNRRSGIRVGDKIRVRSIQGTIKEINLLDTKIQSASGDTIYVPNQMLIKNPVTTHSRKRK